MRGRHLAAIAGMAVIVFSVFFMGSVSAYQGNSGYDVVRHSGSTSNCSSGATVWVQVRDKKKHKPANFIAVTWQIAKSKSSKDKLSAHTTATNKNGIAAVTVRFGPVAGTRTIYATVSRFRYTLTASCSNAGKPTPKPTPKPTSKPNK